MERGKTSIAIPHKTLGPGFGGVYRPICSKNSRRSIRSQTPKFFLVSRGSFHSDVLSKDWPVKANHRLPAAIFGLENTLICDRPPADLAQKSAAEVLKQALMGKPRFEGRALETGEAIQKSQRKKEDSTSADECGLAAGCSEIENGFERLQRNH